MITRKGVARAWGGFSDGRLSVTKDDGTYDEPRYAIFPTKKAALRAYQDVRRIIIQIETDLMTTYVQAPTDEGG